MLAFGRTGGDGHATLPRAGVTWLGSSWVASGQGGHPWDQEAEAGEPEVGEPAERPKNIVNVADLEQERWIDLADAAGSAKSGLNVVTVGAGKLPAPAHCHSAEEEIFVVLEGDGTLELVPSPRARDRGHEEEHVPIRAGHVVARPAGTQISHAFRGGDNGMKVLMYGWRSTNDITYYPRSNKIGFRGVGLMTRLEPLDYWDGEEPPGLDREAVEGEPHRDVRLDGQLLLQLRLQLELLGVVALALPGRHERPERAALVAVDEVDGMLPAVET